MKMRARRPRSLLNPPPVGFEDGGVEVVVNLLEDGDEALVVDGLVLGVQGFAGTDFLEDVVNAGEREVGMKFLLALAVRVEALAKVADALLECAKNFAPCFPFTKPQRRITPCPTLNCYRTLAMPLQTAWRPRFH
jgi:hypothetical protein